MLKSYISYLLWIIKGKPVPAEGNIKRLIIKYYADKNKLNTIIETGTFNGDTVAFMEPYFKTIHSIELSKELYLKAKKRFHNSKNVTIWQGDSGKVIAKLLQKLNKPALFWLDAHGSGGVTAQGDEWSPVIKEVTLIVKHGKKHIILIDDARGFTGHLSPTIAEIERVVAKYHPNYKFEIQDDIIRINLK